MTTIKISENTKKIICEKQFYLPFAEWLVKQKECTKAVSTGDKVRGTRWSNPDVVGVKKYSGLGGTTNYELVSVEIKTSISTGEVITGFGQACAYKLFSHKSYLVIPMDSDEDTLQRIKELCEQHDIGLVVFDRKKPDNPAFTLRCSAKQRGKPNPSYVNKSIQELLKKDGYDIFPPNHRITTGEYANMSWDELVKSILTPGSPRRENIEAIKPTSKENIEKIRKLIPNTWATKTKKKHAALHNKLDELEKSLEGQK